MFTSFVDFKKAFDSMDKKTIVKCLYEDNTP